MLFLQPDDVRNGFGVLLFVHAGGLKEAGEHLTGQAGELFLKFRAVSVQGLIDIVNQKNVSLALALVSAEAVKGILVV